MGSMFSGISEAKISQGGNYVRPGSHIFCIDALKGIRTRQNKDAFVSELTTITSRPGMSLDGSPTRPHAPGEKTSWFVDLSNADSPGLGNAKAFLAAAAEIEVEQIDEAGALAAVSEQQPFAGGYIHCDAVEIETRGGKPFTRCTWRPLTEEERAAVGAKT